MLKIIMRELQSRKYRAFLIGVAVLVASKLGVDVANAEEMVYLVCAYIMGVAVEDMGKSKAQIEAVGNKLIKPAE